MFTGFSSENTPAVKIWDFARPYSTGLASVALENDCAPIQLFKTGGSSAANIRVYLPTAPIEGKIIRIQNLMYGSASSLGQNVEIYSSDASGSGAANAIITIGSGAYIEFIFSKDFISNINAGGTALQTGWVTLNQSSRSAYNYYAISGGNNCRATEHSTIAIGGDGQLASGQGAAAIGGVNNTASALRAAVIGGLNNTASGQYSCVYGGQSNTANNTQSVIFGGESNISSGFRSAIVCGTGHTASGENSIVLGGSNSLANAKDSSVIGGSYGTTRSIFGNSVNPQVIITTTRGITQSAKLVLGQQTTDATPTVLTSNGGTVGTTNQVILPNNSAYTFQGTVIANVTGGGNTSGWKFEGVIKRGANAASTALVAAVTPTVIAQDAGAATWILAITADTTNGGIRIQVTGAAATTIRWVCEIETTEVTY